VSAQRLNDKSTRRISRNTGLEVVRAWSHGGYIFDFVVADPEHPARHRHGWYDKKTGEYAVRQPNVDQTHYDTCFTELFPRQEAS